MGLMSIFKPHKKYFSKSIPPKCDYCHFGKRSKAGNTVICEKCGMVECDYSCGKFVYSPLKRIPVKQLKFVGSLADEDIYSESAYEQSQKLKQKENQKKSENQKKAEEKTEKKAEDNSDSSKLSESEEDINIDGIELYKGENDFYSYDEQDDIIHN